jgi:hypothetical protein
MLSNKESVVTAESFAPTRRYLPAAMVCERYHVTAMTVARWRADSALGFPKPAMQRNGRFYWLESDLNEWDASFAPGGANFAPRPLPPRPPKQPGGTKRRKHAAVAEREVESIQPATTIGLWAVRMNYTRGNRSRSRVTIFCCQRGCRCASTSSIMTIPQRCLTSNESSCRMDFRYS